jgi:hypothetical protein
MRYLILLTLAFAAPVAWAADEAPKLPPAAQAILDTAERAIAANRAKYDDANKKPLADAEKALKTEQDKLGKAGKLEEALAIRKALESFRDELVAKVDERAKERLDFLGESSTSLANRIIGKWKYVDGNKEFVGLVIAEDSLTNSDGHTAKLSYSKNTITANWASVSIYTFVYDEQTDTISGNNAGRIQSFARIK